MTKSQYILDILYLSLDSDDTQYIKKQISLLRDVSYDYTEVGVFVGFKPIGVIGKEFLSKERIIGGVNIESDELEYGAGTILFFNEDGILETLEIFAYSNSYLQKNLTHYILTKD